MFRHRQGFTLIELLVVIVVIGILAAILLPVFGKVQENARTVQCASNLRQIGVALLAYAGEHDATFPKAGGVIAYGATDGTTGLPGWTEQIESYVGANKKIFVCPSSSKVFDPNNKNYSYFMGAHAAYVAANGQFAALRLTLISTPSKYILGGDIATDMFSDIDADKDDYTSNPANLKDPTLQIESPIHNKRVNILYADGHVASATAFEPLNMTVSYDGVNVPGSTYP